MESHRTTDPVGARPAKTGAYTNSTPLPNGKSYMARASPPPLAPAPLDLDPVAGVSLSDVGLVVTTTRAGDLAGAVAPVARRLAVRLREVRPLDDSLESLFRELLR